MDAKERKCAVSRAQDALEVVVAAFETIRNVPDDDEKYQYKAVDALLITLKDNLREWHEQLARKLA